MAAASDLSPYFHRVPRSESDESPHTSRKSESTADHRSHRTNNDTHSGDRRHRRAVFSLGAYDTDSDDDLSSSLDSDTDSLTLFEDLPFDYDGPAIPLNRRRRFRQNGDQDELDPKHLEVPPFPVGDRIYFKEECIICLIDSTHPSLNLGASVLKPRFRPCCSKFVCSPCLEEYCSVKVNDGIVHIGCPNPYCASYLHRDEISFHLKTEPLKEKFYKFLVDANRDPLTKTCPRCCHVTRIKSQEMKPRKIRKNGLKKTCPECDLVWCFPCQAPWHENLSCKEYCAGDVLVAEWAKEVHYGSRNAQKCPKCMVFIERTEGCDHMMCGYCQTDFCYRCGGRYRSLRFLGSHHSRYSIFGCKYYLKPNKPAQRIFIRSSILGGKILAVPALLTVGVALLPFALMAGAVVAPVYGGITLHRYLKRRRWQKVRRRGWRSRPEAPVVLLRVGPIPGRRAGVIIPPCELTSHFESELDSVQMNEIRADLESLNGLDARPNNQQDGLAMMRDFYTVDLEGEKPRQRHRYENTNGRERIRSSKTGRRRAKLPSSFDKPDPDNPNCDLDLDPLEVNDVITDKERELDSARSTSLTCVDVHDQGESDVVHGEGESDVVHGQGESDVIHGQGESDVIHGQGESDVICDQGDNDVVRDELGASDECLEESKADDVITSADCDVVTSGGVEDARPTSRCDKPDEFDVDKENCEGAHDNENNGGDDSDDDASDEEDDVSDDEDDVSDDEDDVSDDEDDVSDDENDITVGGTGDDVTLDVDDAPEVVDGHCVGDDVKPPSIPGRSKSNVSCIADIMELIDKIQNETAI